MATNVRIKLNSSGTTLNTDSYRRNLVYINSYHRNFIYKLRWESIYLEGNDL